VLLARRAASKYTPNEMIQSQLMIQENCFRRQIAYSINGNRKRVDIRLRGTVPPL
jgi:hypothetical protein